MLVRQSHLSSYPLVYTLYAKLTSCSFTFTTQVGVWYQSSRQVLSKKTNLSVSNPSKYQSFHPKLHILRFLKVFFTYWTLHTPSHVWPECSLSAHLKRPASPHYTLKQLFRHWVYTGFIINTTHFTKHLQYVSALSHKCILYCTNDVFLYSFPRYYQMNSINIWRFLSDE